MQATEAEAQQWVASLEPTQEHLRLQIQRGLDSRALMDNPVLEAWFKDSQDKFLEIVDDIPLNDTVARDRVYTVITLLRKLKQSLKQFVEDGELSQKEYKDLLELNKKGLLGGLLGT